MSVFHSHLFQRIRFASFGAPRRPRHPALRIALGLVGVLLLGALLVLGVFAGIAMLAVGMVFRLARQRRTPSPVRAGSIDGDYRVVGKAQLPLAR